MIDAGPALRVIAKQLEPGLSHMNEKSLLGIAFLRMIFGFARAGGQFTPSTGQILTK
jgi:hypothetical protein